MPHEEDGGHCWSHLADGRPRRLCRHPSGSCWVQGFLGVSCGWNVKEHDRSPNRTLHESRGFMLQVNSAITRLPYAVCVCTEICDSLLGSPNTRMLVKDLLLLPWVNGKPAQGIPAEGLPLGNG